MYLAKQRMVVTAYMAQIGKNVSSVASSESARRPAQPPDGQITLGISGGVRRVERRVRIGCRPKCSAFAIFTPAGLHENLLKCGNLVIPIKAMLIAAGQQPDISRCFRRGKSETKERSSVGPVT